MEGAGRVLVVEDDAHIRDLVMLHLQLEGFAVTTTGNGREALGVFNGQGFDLVILDLMIPDLDGVTVCRAIRQGHINNEVPILMLTARREETDKVLGLESGADDYVTKPFGVRELMARVRALLRRRPPATVSSTSEAAANAASAPLGPKVGAAAQAQAAAQGGSRSAPGSLAPTAPDATSGVERPLLVHGVEIDPARRRVRVAGRDVQLTNQEFQLLHLLASHPGIVFSREALLSRIWKNETFVTERSADTLVKRLRRKVEDDAASPRLVLTVWGVGYKFADV